MPWGWMEPCKNIYKFMGKTGQACPRCQTEIVKIQLGGRGHISVPRVRLTMTKVIGLTGGIASGKSTITDFLR